MRSRLARLFTVTLLTMGVLAAVPAGAGAHHGADFDWWVASGPQLQPICEEEPDFCPAPAAAPNGDVIEVTGGGSLSTHPKSAEGGGEFTHHFADGSAVSGTWEVTGLLSFKEWGPGATPPDWRAGRAQFAINLLVGPDVVATGILEVTCVLPEAKVPDSAAEGIRLNAKGHPNFNTSMFGLTLFVATS